MFGEDVKLRKTLVSLTLAAGCATGVFAAQPASANVAQPASSGCQTWHDAATYGVSCSAGGAYRPVAVCNNGQTVYGVWEYGTDGTWSYAYCSSVYSSLNYGYYDYVI
jgi:hypothetical protein